MTRVIPEFPDDLSLGLSREEEQLRELEGRLSKFRPGDQAAHRKSFATGVGLVVSFGFVLAGCLFAGVLLGDFLVARTGSPAMQALGIFLGLFSAGLAGAKLLKPLL